jgi:NADP-dependent 3-hydroxy acid dehydrogenase YdfG
LAARNNNNNISYNKNFEYYKLDITNTNDLVDLHAYIIKKYNRLDILINSAGWEGVKCKSYETSIKDINNIINVNLTGVIYTVNTFINLLKQSNGIIINISSIAAGDNIHNSKKRNLYAIQINYHSATGRSWNSGIGCSILDH